jgi:hypothetical protein
MKAITVMESEIELMNHVIQMKKSKGHDLDFFNNKKELLELEINVTVCILNKKLKNNVELGILEINDYRFIIGKEKEILIELLKRLDKDEKVKNKDFNRKRLQKRLDQVESELNEQAPQEEEIKKDEHQINIEKEEKKKEDIQEIRNQTHTANDNDKDEKQPIISKGSRKEKLIKICNERIEEYKKAIEYLIKVLRL